MSVCTVKSWFEVLARISHSSHADGERKSNFKS